MSSPAVDQSLHYMRKNWPILSAIAVGIFLWGGLVMKVNALEEKSKIRDEDHDAIVRIETEIAVIKNEFAQSRRTQETFRKEQREFREDIEDKIDQNFQMLLRELRERPGS